MNNRFARGSGVYTCGVCGKQTRQTDPDSAGVGLCGNCYEVAGVENFHNDEAHKGQLCDCELCREEMSDKGWAWLQSHKKFFGSPEAQHG